MAKKPKLNLIPEDKTPLTFRDQTYVHYAMFWLPYEVDMINVEIVIPTGTAEVAMENLMVPHLMRELGFILRESDNALVKELKPEIQIEVKPWEKQTKIVIRPGFQFVSVNHGHKMEVMKECGSGKKWELRYIDTMQANVQVEKTTLEESLEKGGIRKI